MSTLIEIWNDFTAPVTEVWDEFVEFIMWLCCSILDFANAGLQWVLDKEIDDG